MTDKRIGLGFAEGIDETGKKCLVKGGDLCCGDVIEVNQRNNKKLFIYSKLDYESIEIFSKYFDKDGLIEFSKLKEVEHKSKPFKRIYEIDGYWVFLERKIKNIAEYLYQHNLIENSRVKISKERISVLGGAPVYGVNYISLLKQVIEKRRAISSWYICTHRKNFNEGIYADLFILCNFCETQLQIQLWEIIEKGQNLFFAHGLLNPDTFEFTHFDLASHFVNPSMIKKLIEKKQRMNLYSKIKWIRIDENLSHEKVFDMIKMFFPLDGLIREFVEIPVP